MNKERKVFVVFQGDRYLYVCSYVMMGVFGTKEKAIHAILEKGEFDNEWIEEQDYDVHRYIKESLEEHMQTNCCGNINYIIKEVDMNVWEEIS